MVGTTNCGHLQPGVPRGKGGRLSVSLSLVRTEEGERNEGIETGSANNGEIGSSPKFGEHELSGLASD